MLHFGIRLLKNIKTMVSMFGFNFYALDIYAGLRAYQSNPIISKRCDNEKETKSEFDFAFQDLNFLLFVKEFVVFR